MKAEYISVIVELLNVKREPNKSLASWIPLVIGDMSIQKKIERIKSDLMSDEEGIEKICSEGQDGMLAASRLFTAMLVAHSEVTEMDLFLLHAHGLSEVSSDLTAMVLRQACVLGIMRAVLKFWSLNEGNNLHNLTRYTYHYLPRWVGGNNAPPLEKGAATELGNLMAEFLKYMDILGDVERFGASLRDMIPVVKTKFEKQFVRSYAHKRLSICNETEMLCLLHPKKG